MTTDSTAVLTIFRSAAQVRILAWLLPHPDREQPIAALAPIAGTASPNVLREVNRLLDAGLLVERVAGRARLVSANANSPLRAPLIEILDEAGASRLPAAVIEQWVAWHAEGLTVAAIADREDVTSDTVLTHLRHVGVSVNVTARPPRLLRFHPLTEQWVAWYAEGLTAAVIAVRSQVSPATVITHLRRAGVTIRARGTVTATDVEQWAAWYAQGVGPAVIAARSQVSPATVITHLRRAGVTTRTRATPDTAHPLTQQWAAWYREGLSTAAIADRSEVSAATVATHLRRAGITIRAASTPGPPRPRHPLTEQWASWYADGLTGPEIAARAQVSPRTVLTHLRRAGITIRGRGKAATPHLLTEQWAAWYSQGLSARTIANRSQVSTGTVRTHLRRAGVTLRSSGAARRPPAATGVEQWTVWYAEGLSARTIADRAKTDPAKVRECLRQAGVTIRTGGRVRRPPAATGVEQWTVWYAEGLSARTIANRSRVDPGTVLTHLRHAGATIRSAPPTATDLTQWATWYAAGLSATAIADRAQTAPSTVLRHLHHLGVTIRTRGTVSLPPADVVAQWVAWYSEGVSSAAIATRADVGVDTVLLHLHRAGVAVRPPGRVPRTPRPPAHHADA